MPTLEELEKGPGFSLSISNDRFVTSTIEQRATPL